MPQNGPINERNVLIFKMGSSQVNRAYVKVDKVQLLSPIVDTVK